MKRCVLFVRHYLKVFRTVVILDAIDVMDNFMGNQQASDLSLSDKCCALNVAVHISPRMAGVLDVNISGLAGPHPSTLPPMILLASSLVHVDELVPAVGNASASVADRLSAAASAKWWGRIVVSHLCRLLCDMCGQGLGQRYNAARVPLIVSQF